MESRTLVFDYGESTDERLDRFLAGAAPEYSRARLQALIKDGKVRVNGLVLSKAGHLLKRGDHIHLEVPPVASSGLLPEDIPLDIVFENADLMVVNKPAGMVVHPAAGHSVGTLVNAAIHHDPGMEGVGGEDRPGVVHRLDKDTSGLVLLAKNDRALHWLQQQFSTRRVNKTYIALVDGRPPSASGKVDAPVGRDPAKRQMMAVVPPGKGRQAVSEFKTLETFPEHTLLEIHPLTGRTHQIRVHCAFLECPIVGDKVYGRRVPSIPIGRHFLHAKSLEVLLPGESRPQRFSVELPADLVQVLDSLRKDLERTESKERQRRAGWNS